MRITRRQFVSWGLAAGAVLGVEGVGNAFYGHVMRTSSRMDEPIPSACRACSAGCGIVGYLRDKTRLTAILGNPEHPVSQGKVCALAVAAMNLQLHPERLWQAQRRDGSTLEIPAALEEAGKHIAQLVSGGAQVVIDTWDEQQAHADFLASLGGGGRLIGREALADAASEYGMSEVWGTPVRPDLDRADLLLVFQDQPLDNGPRFIQDARRIIDAQIERGMKLVVLDPRLTTTGSKADVWLPIRPGTARVAALALARFALENMSLSEPVIMRGQYVPRYFLAETIGAYRLDYAAKVCGVDPAHLEEAGQLLAKASRPATMAGPAVFEGEDAAAAYAAIALIDLLHRTDQVPVMSRPRNVPPESAINGADAENLYRRIEAGDERGLVLITHRANPVYERGSAIERALADGRVAYHVSISPLPNETTREADLVIPETVPLESRGRVWLTAHVPTPTYVEQRPVAPPPKGVLSAETVFAALAKHQAVPDAATPAHDMQIVRDLTGAGSFFKIADGIYAADSGYDPRLSYGVPLQFFRDMQPLTMHEPETLRPVLLLHGGPVVNRTSAQAKWLAEIQHDARLLINADDARRLRVRTGDVMLARPDGEPVQPVRVAVFVSDGLRPGCVAMLEGQGHDGSGRLAAAERFKTAHDPDMKLMWWEHEGAGVNLAPLEKRVPDDAAGVVRRPITRLRLERI